MEHITQRHIFCALPLPDRVAGRCERLPFWYMSIRLWHQDTRLNMFVSHTQRPPYSFNWWRMTWDRRLQVCTSPVNVVGPALDRLPIYWNQGQTAPQAYPTSEDMTSYQRWRTGATLNMTTKFMTTNSYLSNPVIWTILSGENKRPSSIPTTETCQLSILNRPLKPIIHSLKEWRRSQKNSYKWPLYNSPELHSNSPPPPGPHTSMFSSSLITSTISRNSNSTSFQTAPKWPLWIPSGKNEGRPI